MNEVVRQLRRKGYTVGEFLIIINRGSTWWHTHKCDNSKDYALLMLAVKGLDDRLNDKDMAGFFDNAFKSQVTNKD